MNGNILKLKVTIRCYACDTALRLIEQDVITEKNAPSSDAINTIVYVEPCEKCIKEAVGDVHEFGESKFD